MTDQELLLAISNIVQSQVQPLKEDVKALKTDMEILKSETKALRTDMTVLQADVKALRNDMTVLQTEVKALQADMTVLQTDVKALQADMTVLQTDMKAQKLMMENKVLPRLQNIEACYTSTYRRYADGIDDLEALQTDMEIVKKVVSEHSEKLQKIS